MKKKFYSISVLIIALLSTHSVMSCKKTNMQTPAESVSLKEPAKKTMGHDSPVKSIPEEVAKRIHSDAIVMDAHCDSIMKVVDDGVDLGVRSDSGHIDIPRMKEGGLDVQVFAVWVETHHPEGEIRKRALKMIDALHEMFSKYPDRIELAKTAADAGRIVKNGKIAGFIGIEGGHAIEDDLETLRLYYEKGARYMTLTHWEANNWADGSGGEAKWHGLNEFGEKVVREMDRIGMIIDVSHVSEETFWDVLKVTKNPVIASHSNTRALCDHHRNLTDKQLRALAEQGGAICINYVSGFLDEEYRKQAEAMYEKIKPELDEIEKKYSDNPGEGRKQRWKYYGEKAKEMLPAVRLDRVIDHIDHAVKVAGIDHVCLGSDFDGFSIGPVEMTDVTKLPLITQKLIERGYSEKDIKKILGENLLRVFGAVLDKNQQEQK